MRSSSRSPRWPDHRGHRLRPSRERHRAVRPGPGRAGARCGCGMRGCAGTRSSWPGTSTGGGPSTRRWPTPKPPVPPTSCTCWGPHRSGPRASRRSPGCTARDHVAAPQDVGLRRVHAEGRQALQRPDHRLPDLERGQHAQLLRGDWVALAKLTRRAYDTIKMIDDSALVVGASSTVIPGRLFQTELLRALRAGDPRRRRPGGRDGGAPVPGGHQQGRRRAWAASGQPSAS